MSPASQALVAFPEPSRRPHRLSLAKGEKPRGEIRPNFPLDLSTLGFLARFVRRPVLADDERSHLCPTASEHGGVLRDPTDILAIDLARDFDHRNLCSLPPHQVHQQGVRTRVQQLCSQQRTKLYSKPLLDRSVIGRPTLTPIKERGCLAQNVTLIPFPISPSRLASLPTHQLTQFGFGAGLCLRE